MLGDDAGLTPYMKGEIKTAFEIDSGLFEKDTFIELFGEAKQFDRILMRIVAELFAEKIAAIYENTLLTIKRSANEAIAPKNSTRLSQHETLREVLEAVVIEESAEYVVKDAECGVPTEAPEEYNVEYAVYGALSLSDEAAADAVRENMPESKNALLLAGIWKRPLLVNTLPRLRLKNILLFSVKNLLLLKNLLLFSAKKLRLLLQQLKNLLQLLMEEPLLLLLKTLLLLLIQNLFRSILKKLFQLLLQNLLLFLMQNLLLLLVRSWLRSRKNVGRE